MRCAVALCQNTPDACPVIWADRALGGVTQVQVPIALCFEHMLKFDVHVDFVLEPTLRRAAEDILEEKGIVDTDWRTARLVQWARLVGSDHDLKRKHDDLLVPEDEDPQEDPDEGL